MSTKVIHSVKLKKDEIFSLPAGAKVTSLIGGATSDCTTLPTAETLKCYGVQYELNITDDQVLSECTIEGVRIGTTNYFFSVPFKMDASANDTTSGLVTAFGSNDFTKNSTFSICGGTYVETTRYKGYVIRFKGIPSIYGSDCFIIMSDNTSLQVQAPQQYFLPLKDYADLVSIVGAQSCPCTN